MANASPNLVLTPQQLASNKSPIYLAGILPNKLYTTREVSNITGMTVSYFEAARMRGGGPEYVKVGARSVRYLGQSLIVWLAQGIRQNTSQAERLVGSPVRKLDR